MLLVYFLTGGEERPNTKKTKRKQTQAQNKIGKGDPKAAGRRTNTWGEN